MNIKCLFILKHVGLSRVPFEIKRHLFLNASIVAATPAPEMFVSVLIESVSIMMIMLSSLSPLTLTVVGSPDDNATF